MIYFTITLLLIGIACLIAELLIPGFGFFGISGIISVLSAFALTWLAIPNGIYWVVIEIIIVVAMSIIAYKIFKSKSIKSKIILNETLKEDRKEFNDLQSFIGKQGVCETPLKPFGNVNFNGIIKEVSSEGDYINRGENVIVTKIKDDKLFVTKIKSDNLSDKKEELFC